MQFKLLTSENKWIRIAFHAVIWIIVFAMPYLLDNPGPPKASSEEQEAFFLLRLCTYFLLIPLFYLNSEMLTPKLVHTRKFFLYILTLILAFAAIVFIHGILYKYFILKGQPYIIRNHHNFKEYYSIAKSIRYNLPTFMLTIAVGLLYRMSRDRMKAEEILHQTQEENLKTELSFLRSQISPHFVFNVLNNIVAMVRLKHENLEETVIKLSSLMQYMLYEANDEKVLLKREAEYLQSYIDLQQQRFGSKVQISTAVSLSDDWDGIEPMLLIPFVENAFKHGVGMIEDPQIDIKLKTQDKVLYFSVRNKFNPDLTEIKDKTSGIGLTNVSRRLNLLYAGEHSLTIESKNGWFIVSLQLNLHA